MKIELKNELKNKLEKDLFYFVFQKSSFFIVNYFKCIKWLKLSLYSTKKHRVKYLKIFMMFLVINYLFHMNN